MVRPGELLVHRRADGARVLEGGGVVGVLVAALAWAYGGLPILFKLAALALAWRWRTQLEAHT